MTFVYILASLLSSPKSRGKRTALEAAAQRALIVWKTRIDDALGYDASDVERWIIVHSRHRNSADLRQHATIRGYTNGQPVATMHLRLTKDFVATGINVWANGVPMTAQVTDLVGTLQDAVYCVIYNAQSPFVRPIHLTHVA
ncbi:hypothetical protein PTI98_009347 [Pleurotus ostreatus]|nr:hypothetical protein PTI98_009347 [Pleurotus ostreatus]